MSADGHTRICASCNKIWYLPWVPGPMEQDKFYCQKCRRSESSDG